MLNLKSFEFSPIRENTYLIYNEFNECIIIDPGCYYDHEKDELLQFINKMDLKPELLLNTHCHLDHVFGNRFIAEKFNLTLHIHKNEKLVPFEFFELNPVFSERNRIHLCTGIIACEK